MRYVVPDEGRPPSWRDLERTLRTLDSVRLEAGTSAEGLPCFRYWNPDTRVAAWFLGYVPEGETEVGLAFEMAQPRPEYFAHEALPLAVQVARELHLDALPHPAEPDIDATPTSKESLLALWQRRNAEARAALEREHGPAPTFRADDLEMSWEYLTLREELDRRYGRRGVVVPDIEYVRVRKTGQVQRMCRWTGLSPSVFPPVDLIYLERPPAPLKTGKILSADELSELARRWVKDVVQPIFHRLYVEEKPPEAFLEILVGMKGSTMRTYDPVAVEDLNDL